MDRCLWFAPQSGDLAWPLGRLAQFMSRQAARALSPTCSTISAFETLRDPTSASFLVCRELPQDGVPSPKRLSEPGSVRRGPQIPQGHCQGGGEQALTSACPAAKTSRLCFLTQCWIYTSIDRVDSVCVPNPTVPLLLTPCIHVAPLLQPVKQY